MTAHFENWKLAIVSKHFGVRVPERREHAAKEEKQFIENKDENDDIETIVEETLTDGSISSSRSHEGLAELFDEHTFEVLECIDIENRATNVENELMFSDVDVIIDEILTKIVQRTDDGESLANNNSDQFGDAMSSNLKGVHGGNEDMGTKRVDCQNNVCNDISITDMAQGVDVDVSQSFSRDGGILGIVENVDAGDGDIFKNLDVRLKKRENKSSTDIKYETEGGGNCVSVILIWDRAEFYKHGGKRGGRQRIKNMAASVCSCWEGSFKFKYQSSIGNQIRNDFVFGNEAQALQFLEKVSVAEVPENVNKRIIVSNEEDFGLGLEHVLSEEDILFLANIAHTNHLFRHFLECRILTNGDQIMFKFSSLSDVNLFLFNKSIPRYKLLGRLRKLSQLHKFKLVSNKEDGAFVLETKDLMTFTRTKSWADLSSRFMFKTVSKEGSSSRQLLFRNKRDLFHFYVSEEGKELTSLWIPQIQIVKQENQKPDNIGDIDIELLIERAMERHQSLESELTSRKKQLEYLKKKMLRNDRGIEANRLYIKKLSAKISSIGQVVPSTLTIQDVLKLEFKEENETGSNYPLCLRNFLQSDELVKVEEVDGDIVFSFSGCDSLEKLLNSQCKKTAQKWSAVSKLPQRAGFVTEKLFKTYGLLVYLEETSLLKKPIKQIEDELKAKNAKVECRAFGFAARFSTLLSFLQGLVDREIHAYHRVLFMQENVAFIKRTDRHKFFKGRVCLNEDDCLRLRWKNSEENQNAMDANSVERFLAGFSKFLLDPRVEEVSEDWLGRVILCFDSEESLDTLLVDHCDTECNHVNRLPSIPPIFALQGPSYSVRCPHGVDLRHFFMIDNECFTSSDILKISSPSRLFPFLCLTSKELRGAYPSLCLHSEDFVTML